MDWISAICGVAGREDVGGLIDANAVVAIAIACWEGLIIADVVAAGRGCLEDCVVPISEEGVDAVVRVL